MNKRVFVGIGSNEGDGVQLCAEGIKRILADSRSGLVGLSSFYVTSPVSPIPQNDFTNGAVAITWDSSPRDLLEFLNRIELHMGRTRTVPWGPRVIDLDILLFGDLVLNAPLLTIPHPELHRRRFAMAPCVEIDASLVHPVYKRSLISFLDHIDPSQEVSISLGSAEVLSLVLPSTGEGWDN